MKNVLPQKCSEQSVVGVKFGFLCHGLLRDNQHLTTSVHTRVFVGTRRRRHVRRSLGLTDTKVSPVSSFTGPVSGGEDEGLEDCSRSQGPQTQ